MKTINCYFDETEFTFHSNNYLALAGVFVEDEVVSEIESILFELKEDLEVDQFIGKKEDSRIFHYTEDNLEIRPRVVECLRFQKLRVYIAFHSIEIGYKETYLHITKKILFDRFQEMHNCKFNIFYEENSKIKSTYFKNAINDMILQLQGKFSALVSPKIEKISKENILCVLPDYFLGVFRDYHKDKKKRQDHMVRSFDKLRAKIRLIIDIKDQRYYSRNNPYIICYG
jgi:hypothetical protein